MDTPKHPRWEAPLEREEAPLLHRIKSPFSTWWQVKDSNLRSFRDGFTVPSLRAYDQRKRLTHNNFRTYSPQTADASRGQPDTSGARARSPSDRD
jgi:hypothetical protein